jgi:transglutaminase-like putative cysteine protease
MYIKSGYEITFDCTKPTPMLLVLSVHPSRLPDLRTPQDIAFDRDVTHEDYLDGFGNICTRTTLPSGLTTISNEFVIVDSGLPDVLTPGARQHPIEELPTETLVYLLGSRYCETDRLGDVAWALFAGTEPGWARVQAICDYAHERITFGYHHARGDKSAWEAYSDRTGVCRDYAHLAIALCRCMNIPARYCTGYMGDIGVPVVDPMDFSAWFEVYLDGAWHTFDARNNKPRIGRILIARGRDATDVAISTSFGASRLAAFKVVAIEVPAAATAQQ